MADNTRPSRAADMDKAEGERSTAEQSLQSQARPEHGHVPTDPGRDFASGSVDENADENNDWPAERSER